MPKAADSYRRGTAVTCYLHAGYAWKMHTDRVRNKGPRLKRLSSCQERELVSSVETPETRKERIILRLESSVEAATCLHGREGASGSEVLE
jgi:hypothetical protein